MILAEPQFPEILWCYRTDGQLYWQIGKWPWALQGSRTLPRRFASLEYEVFLAVLRTHPEPLP